MDAKTLFTLTDEEDAFWQILRDALRDRLPHPDTGELLPSLVEIRDSTLTGVHFDKKVLENAETLLKKMRTAVLQTDVGSDVVPKTFSAFEEAFREFKREIEDTALNPSHFNKKKAEQAFAIFRNLCILGLGMPEEFGGQGNAGSRMDIIVGETLSAIDAAITLSFGAAHSLAMKPILVHGTDAQKKKWLPRMVSGEIRGCYCQTEPDTGSNVAGIKGYARQDKDGVWRVWKQCQFITGGDQSGVALVLVKTPVADDDEHKGESHYGFTMFLVDLELARRENTVEFLRNESKAGLEMSPTTAMNFEGAVADSVLGELHRGWRIAMSLLAGSRATAIPAQAIGIGQTMSDEARKYAVSRTQFDRTLSTFPVQRERMLRIDLIYAARLLAWHAAMLKDELGHKDQRPWEMEASIAKLFASETGVASSLEAMRLMGGMGYMRESFVPKFLADSLVIPIYEGTNDIQKIVIMRWLLQRFGGKRLKWLVFPMSRFAAAKHFASEWPVASAAWPNQEKEFKADVVSASAYAKELRVLLHDLLGLRADFLRTFGKTLAAFPPDPKDKTFPSPYFKLAHAFAALEGAKLVLWDTAFRTKRGKKAPETDAVALATMALSFAKEPVLVAENHVADLMKFPSFRKEIEGK